MKYSFLLIACLFFFQISNAQEVVDTIAPASEEPTTEIQEPQIEAPKTLEEKLPTLFDQIHQTNITAYFCEKQVNKVHYETAIAYYEWTTDENIAGCPSMFIVPKRFAPEWLYEVIHSPKTECAKDPYAAKAVLARCEYTRLYSQGLAELNKEFDIYIYVIPMEDMDGPFSGTAEGGYISYYYPKKGGRVFVFKFDGEKWEQVDTIYQQADSLARTIGIKAVKEQVLKKIDEYIKAEEGIDQTDVETEKM